MKKIIQTLAGIVLLITTQGQVEKLQKPLSKADTIPTIKRDAGVKPVTINVLRDIDFDNWGFEKGLAGWTKEGTAFNNQPTLGDNVASQRVLWFMEYNNGGIGGN